MTRAVLLGAGLLLALWVVLHVPEFLDRWDKCSDAAKTWAHYYHECMKNREASASIPEAGREMFERPAGHFVGRQAEWEKDCRIETVHWDTLWRRQCHEALKAFFE
jgi:hypothetical protein